MHPQGSRLAHPLSPHLHRAKPLQLPSPSPWPLPLTLLLLLAGAGSVPWEMLMARLAAHSRQAACSLVHSTCSSFSQIFCGLQCIQQQGYHQQICKVSTTISIPQSCKEHAVCCSVCCLLQHSLSFSKSFYIPSLVVRFASRSCMHKFELLALQACSCQRKNLPLAIPCCPIMLPSTCSVQYSGRHLHHVV